MPGKPAPKLLLALPLLMFAILGLLYFYGLTYDPNKYASRLIGKATPVLKLPSLFNTETLLDSTSIKGPALINVWASWCGACREEHAELKRIAAEENINIYAIDYQDDAEIARTWLKQNGNPFVWVMFDGAAAAGLPLDIFSLPQTYLVDAQGVIRARHIGALNPAIWQEMKTKLPQ
ncbi:MAG: DsbE family thiol:disulfide interchange protein [Methylococcales bacterium]|nr:DsbE family thiol:disulfide interchange protein [Methylococcales bacterium]